MVKPSRLPPRTIHDIWEVAQHTVQLDRWKNIVQVARGSSGESVFWVWVKKELVHPPVDSHDGLVDFGDENGHFVIEERVENHWDASDS